MPSYTLEISAIGQYLLDTPSLQIWEDGVLHSTYSISSTGTSFSTTINYPGALPSSLSFKFDDISIEPGRSIQITSVRINDQFVNTSNFLSADSLTHGQSAVVDVPETPFLFDGSDPDLSLFTTDPTQTFTATNNRYRNYSETEDQTFDMLAGRDVVYLGSGNDKVNGNDGNDIIYSGDGDDLLFGGSGNDRLNGGDGEDLLYGGDGNDNIVGGNDDDQLYGGLGNDKLNAGEGDDVLLGGDGNDNLAGGNGNDILYGGDGDDQIVAGNGDDTVDGGAGDDLIYAGNGADVVNGGDDDDYIIGGTGSDTLNGDNGIDTIVGNEGNDIINGGAGADIIQGGLGTDTIDGGSGNDTIYGDAGGLTLVMQAESLEVTQTNSTQWHSVSFDGLIKDAVIKMFASDVTDDPFTIRVRDVGQTGFEFQLDEYDYLDGATGLESISWIAVASGTHTLAGGNVIQAGYTTATDETTTSVTFDNSFSSAPIVFSQLSSDNELSAAVTRNENVSTTGFDLNMHEEEANAVSHATEDIGWIAIESGGSAASGLIAGSTGKNVSHTATSLSYGDTFSGTPIVIADMQIVGGSDPAVVVGLGQATSSGATVYIDEEESNESETNHATEDVGFIAVESGSYTTSGIVNESDIIYGGAGDDTIYSDVHLDSSVANTSTLFPMAKEAIGDGAVAYWALNETSGTTFDNVGSLGASVNGTSTGSPTLGAAALHAYGLGSVDFDGVNDGILIPDSDAINTGTYSEKTVELVFNADDVTTRQVLYEEGGSTHGFSIYLDGGNVYVTGEHDGVWVDADIHAAVTTGTTYHVAFVFDKNDDSFTGYLDGVDMGGAVTVGGVDFPSHSGDVGIGYSPDSLQFHDGEGSSGYYYDGRISDVAIYTTALTQAQLEDHSDIVQGTYSAAAPEAIDDVLYGGDGLDQFFAGAGRDVFVFESGTAFNDVDEINGFDVGENDAIDISDLLIGYIDGVSDIDDFVQTTEVGSDTIISVDTNGVLGGASFNDVVSLNDTLGVSAEALLSNGSIIV